MIEMAKGCYAKRHLACHKRTVVVWRSKGKYRTGDGRHKEKETCEEKDHWLVHGTSILNTCHISTFVWSP